MKTITIFILTCYDKTRQDTGKLYNRVQDILWLIVSSYISLRSIIIFSGLCTNVLDFSLFGKGLFSHKFNKSRVSDT